jgi:hypothetical protein
MRRAAALLAAAAALAAIGGCASWPDKADAEALSRCETEADPDKRRACRETVRAAAESESRARLEALEAEIRRAEEREKARAVYGRP